MTRGRSPGVPGLLPKEYSANENAQVKPPRVLPTAMAAPFCEVRDGRVWIGSRLGESRHAETSFSIAEWRLLIPQLRAVVAQTKETP